eukprot:gene7360-biopygen4952
MPFDKYNVGCYLLDRLAEVGVQDIFGVPGDFNLRFLDDLMTHPVNWIGSANELNAAYAADGYARQRGIGALVTTYGVGELSAINGIAGCASESVPVISIVGAPPYKLQDKRYLIHHSLGDGDFNHFLKMHKECCCAAEMLTPENARRQIDHVITEVLYHKKPGYIAIPTDVTALSVEPPAAALVPRLPALSENSVEAFKEAAAAMLNNAKSASLLVGHLVERFNVIPAVNQFVENVNIPYSVGALGKGCVKETLKTYSGIYIPGIIPFPAQDIVEHSDVSITFGVEMTDAVTAGFKQKFPKNTIHVNPFEVVVGEQRFSQVPIAVAIAVLQEICKAAQGKWKNKSCVPEAFKQPADPKKYDLTHMWREIQASLKPNDIILADMGTSGLSSVLLHLPEGCTFYCQCMYSSIGFTLPAAIGCQLASPDRRVICIIGDGAAQMTVQELGTAARHNLPIQYLLVNNDGYTIERYIRGMKADYNDIVPYNWIPLAKAFCMTNEPITHTAVKPGELEKILKDTPKKMQFIETFIDKFDAPLRSPLPLPLPED